MKKFFILITFVAVLSFYGCSEDEITNPQHDHYEAFGMNIYKHNTLYMKILNAKIDDNYNSYFDIDINAEAEIFNIVFLDENGNEMKNPENDEMKLDFLISDTSIVKAYIWVNSKWEFVLDGLKRDSTAIEIRLNHIDHPDFKTPLIPVIVK
jgi:hypothetical protein